MAYLECKKGGIVIQHHDKIKFEFQDIVARALIRSVVRDEPQSYPGRSADVEENEGMSTPTEERGNKLIAFWTCESRILMHHPIFNSSLSFAWARKEEEITPRLQSGPTFGLPCRHQACSIKPIKPYHVIARHHATNNQAKKLLRKSSTGIRGSMGWFSVTTNSRTAWTMWKSFRISKKNLLPDVFGSKSSQVAHAWWTRSRDCTWPNYNVFFEAGSFSQGNCLHQPGKQTASSVEDVVPVVHQACSLCRLIYVVLSGIRRLDPTLQFTSHGILFVLKVCLRNLAGDHVSVSAPVDRRRKYVRIKSASEHPATHRGEARGIVVRCTWIWWVRQNVAGTVFVRWMPSGVPFAFKKVTRLNCPTCYVVSSFAHLQWLYYSRAHSRTPEKINLTKHAREMQQNLANH